MSPPRGAVPSWVITRQVGVHALSNLNAAAGEQVAVDVEGGLNLRGPLPDRHWSERARLGPTEYERLSPAFSSQLLFVQVVAQDRQDEVVRPIGAPKWPRLPCIGVFALEASAHSRVPSAQGLNRGFSS
jgi:hypothetical protein